LYNPNTKGRVHVKGWHIITATVEIDGQPRNLIAHVMETSDGNFHYDLSKNKSDGARFKRNDANTAIIDSRYGKEDNP
jgi:hypothetical protein